MSQIENNDSTFPTSENDTELINHTETSSKTIDYYEEKTAGFWMRFWAFAIDWLIVGALVGILVKPIFHLFNWSLSESTWYAPMTIISGLVFYAYFILTTKFLQQTIGKMIFGLKVKGKDGEKLGWLTVIFREVIGRFISNTIPVIYIVVAFMPKNLGLTDFVADTIVVHEKVFTKKEKVFYSEPSGDDDNMMNENSISTSI